MHKHHTCPLDQCSTASVTYTGLLSLGARLPRDNVNPLMLLMRPLRPTGNGSLYRFVSTSHVVCNRASGIRFSTAFGAVPLGLALSLILAVVGVAATVVGPVLAFHGALTPGPYSNL